MEESSSSFLPTAMITTGCVTIVLASILAYTILLQKQRSKRGNKGVESDDTKNSTEDVFDYDKYPGGSITIYYATQTGTAESFSQSLEREGNQQHGFLVHVVDLEDAIISIQEKLNEHNNNNNNNPSKELPQLLAPRSIFITATYGEGEAPDGAVPFCQWLQEIITDTDGTNSSDSTENNVTNRPFHEITTPTDDETNRMMIRKSILSNVEYAVFGLGNTQYEHYNATSKFIDMALYKAGAQRIIPIAFGDDNQDIENDFDTWKDQSLWPTLKQKYHIHHQNNSTTTTSNNGTSMKNNKIQELPKCPLKVVYHYPSKNDIEVLGNPDYNVPLDQIHSSCRHYFTAYECPIQVVRELQSSSTTNTSGTTTNNNNDDLVDSTVHIEIDIRNARSLQSTTNSTPTLSYHTADNLGVLPVNHEDIVNRVADALGYDLDQIISIVPSPDNGDWHGLPFPIPISIRECLSRYLDLTSAPRRSDLKRLSIYCTDIVDQKALIRMSSKEGRQEYKEKILDQYVGLVDLLRLCPSIHMPLEHFIHYCSPLQTRFFTISSSSSVHPNSIHLTVAVTKHQRLDGTLFHGVCSTHLSNNTTIPKMIRVFQRPSSFRLPTDPTKPIIMIGPGTGIAPMRALLQEREYQRDVLKKAVGTNTLYFGCKYKLQDYLYRDEIETWAKPDGILNGLYVAFSRDQSTKVYVQDLLRQNGTETWDLIRDDNYNNNCGGAYVYICGGVKMGQDVTEALREIISVHGNMTTELAKEYLSKLSHDGRFVQELWA